MKKLDKSINILGVSLTGSSKQEVLGFLTASLESKPDRPLSVVVTPNPEQLVLAQTDDVFRHILNQSTLALPDGVGLIWAAKILDIRYQISNIINSGQSANHHKLERMPGIEIAEKLIQICGEKGLRLMLYGGRKGVAQKAGIKIRNSKLEIRNNNQISNIRYQTLDIVGLDGPTDVSNVTSDERSVFIQAVEDFKPHLLLIGLGAPWQEKWLWEYRNELQKAGVRVAMVVGGAFDVWAGRVKRAPRLVRKLGLEWLWRLVQEPWRWKRQLKLLTFIRLVFK